MSIVYADKGVQIRRGRRHVHDQSQIGSQVTKVFPMLAFLTLIVLVFKKNVYFAACGLIMFIFYSEYIKRSLKI